MEEQSRPVAIRKKPRFKDVSAFTDWLDNTSLDDVSSGVELSLGQPAMNGTNEKFVVETFSPRNNTVHRIVEIPPEQDHEQGDSTGNFWIEPENERPYFERFSLDRISDYDSYGWGKKLCRNCLYLVIQSQFQAYNPFSRREFDTREFCQCITCPLVKSLSSRHNDEVSQIQPRFGDPQPQNGFWYSQINILKSNRSIGLIGFCRKFPEPEHALPVSHGLLGSPQRWLRHSLLECDTNHTECRRFKDPAVDIYLIDVLQHCSVSANSKWRYLALSYVWGGVDQLKTKKNNIPDFLKLGGLQKHAETIPRLIKDAIELVRSVGERYLWVDSLCIVQDDDTERHRQISQMGTIYGNAYLTIAAISASNAQSPLPGVGSNAEFCGYTSVADDLKVFATRNSLSDALLYSKYDTRGWTYQERLLSHRCVYLSEWEWFFSCDTEVSREYQELIYPHRNAYHGPPEAPIEYAENPLHRLQSRLEHPSKYDISLHVAFSAFSEVAESHSRKNLLYHKDRLFAFEGILARLATLLGCPIIRDIPKSAFQYGLIWMPSATYQPMASSATSHSPGLPTWSWTAFDSEIDYKFARHLLQIDSLGYRPISFNPRVELIEPDRRAPATSGAKDSESWQQALFEKKYSHALLMKTEVIELDSLKLLPDQNWKSKTFNGHKIHLLADTNNTPYIALFGCLYQPGETQTYELVEMGRIASPRYYRPPPVYLEHGSVATTISFLEDLLGRRELVIVLFTECTSSFSKRLGFGFVAHDSWESGRAQHTTVCII